MTTGQANLNIPDRKAKDGMANFEGHSSKASEHAKAIQKWLFTYSDGIEIRQIFEHSINFGPTSGTILITRIYYKNR